MKIKTLLIFLSLLFSVFLATGQDRILYNDGTILEGRVQRINESQVFFLRTSDNALQIVDRTQLKGIEYGIGVRDKIRSGFIERKALVFRHRPFHDEFRPWMFQFNVLSLTVGKISMATEYVLKSGKVGIRVPLEMTGSNSNFGHSNYFWDYSIGTELNFYPGGQGRVRYFLGPGIKAGQVSNAYHSPKSSSPYHDEDGIAILYQTGAVALMFNQGVMLQFSRTFGVVARLGLGAVSYEGRTDNRTYTRKGVFADPSLSINVRF